MEKRLLKNIDYSVYAVTDRSWLNGRALKDCVRDAIIGGATIIQLREKELNDDDFLALAIEIKQVCDKYNIPLIINDNVNVMIKSNADGIHIGQNDMDAKIVRKMIGPDKILGVSTQTVEESIKAYDDGADYLGVGAVFPTNTKLDAVDVTIDELRRINSIIDIPVVAIGGIHLNNINQLKNTNLAGVAVVSEIFKSDDIINSTKMLKKEVDKLFINLNKYDLFIMDYDGTMLDSTCFWKNIASNYVKSKGINPKNDLDIMTGKLTSYETAVLIHNDYNLYDNAGLVLDDCIKYIYDTYTRLKIKKNVLNYLSYLKSLNKRIIILSATDKSLIEGSLKNNNIDEYVDYVYSSSDLKMSKSDKNLYFEIIKNENTDINRTIIFEDSLYAIKAINETGIDLCAVPDMNNFEMIDEIIKYMTYYGRVGNI